MAPLGVTLTAADGGKFAFPPQPIAQTYELSVAKEGFDTKSIVVQPKADGTPLDVNVELTPAKGALGGVVTGPNGPLGGVDIVITDGTLTFRATSSTDPASVGHFLVTGLSTPGAYTLQATREGLGTAVVLETLGNGSKLVNLVIPMKVGVGTISGKVTIGGVPRGGVSLTVANASLTRSSNSFTVGDIGGAQRQKRREVK